MSVLWRLPEVAPALVRHLLGYSELAGEASTEWLRQTRTRAATLAAGALAAMTALVISSVWFVMSAWALPQRHWVIGGAVFVLLLTGGLLVRHASGTRRAGLHLQALEREWAQDRELLQQWQNQT